MTRRAAISPARAMLQLAWDHTPRGSWQRLNEAMYGAAKLAVRAGLPFAKDDFDYFAEKMRMHFWVGQTGVEGLYAEAVACDNVSACQAVEAYRGREPFVYDGKRIYVGRDFVWQGEAVTCTSIDGDSLIACSYHNGRSGKIKHRFTITLEDVRAIARATRAEQKAAKEAREKAQREEEDRRRAEDEARRAQWEVARQERRAKCIADIVGAPADLLALPLTVDVAASMGLCREGVIDFCDRYLAGRKEGPLQVLVPVLPNVVEDHYLESVAMLVRKLAERAS